VNPHEVLSVLASPCLSMALKKTFVIRSEDL